MLPTGKCFRYPKFINAYDVYVAFSYYSTLSVILPYSGLQGGSYRTPAIAFILALHEMLKVCRRTSQLTYRWLSRVWSRSTTSLFANIFIRVAQYVVLGAGGTDSRDRKSSFVFVFLTYLNLSFWILHTCQHGHLHRGSRFGLGKKKSDNINLILVYFDFSWILFPNIYFLPCSLLWSGVEGKL